MQCPQWAMHLNHLPGPSHSVSRVCCESAVSGVLCVSYGELISGCLPLADVSHPGSQKWLEPGSLLTVWWRMLVSGVRLQQPLAFWLWLWHACLCVSGWGEGPVHSQLPLLLYLLSPLFCEQARLLVRPFTGNFPFFFFLSIWRFCVLGYYLTLAPSDCPQGIQAQSLP